MTVSFNGRFAALLSAILFLLGLTAGTSDAEVYSAEAAPTFGFRLLRQLVLDSSAENVVISPVSVEMCLAMAMNGAGGSTRAEIARTLGGTDTSLDETNKRYAELTRTFALLGGDVELSIANSVWGSNRLGFKREFASACSTSYAAGVKPVDFGDPSAIRMINGWVSQQTHRLISTAIERIDPLNVALVLSAVFFKGRWTKPFDPRDTRPDTFHLMHGGKVMRQMMWQIDDFDYLSGDGFSAVALPFKHSGFSMYVFVPDDTIGLPAFLCTLNDENWRRWMSKFKKKETYVILPRFKAGYETSLPSALKSMGVISAFNRKDADFTPMFENPRAPVWLGDLAHKALIEVDEAGATAAAATGGVAVTGVAELVFADRPFFFAIRDRKSGALLFMGAICDPPQ